MLQNEERNVKELSFEEVENSNQCFVCDQQFHNKVAFKSHKQTSHYKLTFFKMFKAIDQSHKITSAYQIGNFDDLFMQNDIKEFYNTKTRINRRVRKNKNNENTKGEKHIDNLKRTLTK